MVGKPEVIDRSTSADGDSSTTSAKLGWGKDELPDRRAVVDRRALSNRRGETVYLIHGTSVAPAFTKTSTVPVCASQF